MGGSRRIFLNGIKRFLKNGFGKRIKKIIFYFLLIRLDPLNPPNPRGLLGTTISCGFGASGEIFVCVRLAPNLTGEDAGPPNLVGPFSGHDFLRVWCLA